MSRITARTQKQIAISVEVARSLQAQGVVFKGATIHQTLGPHWQHIIWIVGATGKRCHVSPSHDITSIIAMTPERHVKVTS